MSATKSAAAGRYRESARPVPVIGEHGHSTRRAPVAGGQCARLPAVHTLTFLEPGHFHATLTLRAPHAAVAPEVFVYASAGPELDDFLALVERFNRRAERPTDWRPRVRLSADPLAQLLVERPGDVVVLAGKNGGKARVMRRLHASGLHVLADKPWLVEPADLAEIRASLAGGPIAREMMTGRRDTIGRLVKRLVDDAPLFGGFATDGAASPPSSRRASTTSRSAWTARRSAAPGGSSIRASRAAARWTSRPTRSTRPSGCSTPTPRPATCRSCSPRGAGPRGCPSTSSPASPARAGCRRSCAARWRATRCASSATRS